MQDESSKIFQLFTGREKRLIWFRKMLFSYFTLSLQWMKSWTYTKCKVFFIFQNAFLIFMSGLTLVWKRNLCWCFALLSQQEPRKDQFWTIDLKDIEVYKVSQSIKIGITMQNKMSHLWLRIKSNVLDSVNLCMHVYLTRAYQTRSFPVGWLYFQWTSSGLLE